MGEGNINLDDIRTGNVALAPSQIVALLVAEVERLRAENEQLRREAVGITEDGRTIGDVEAERDRERERADRIEQGIASEGVRRIAAERDRQTTEEGWSREHDARHRSGAMARAAACYALPDEVRDRLIWTAPLRTLLWTWESGWWKPKDRIRDLERAGALIAAEIDRLLADGDSGGGSAS